LALVVLALWVVTAAAGVALLSSGNAARRRMAPSAQLASTPARSGAVPLTADGKPPPVPRTRVAAPAGEHPLLEFSHPALALSGLAFWFVFVLIHYRPLAWISLGILVVTLSAGLSWLAANARAARRQQKAARPFPPRLIALHGLAAAVALTLTVLTALSASHG
jgi:Flp pilus assembly protein TadB